MYQRIKVLNRLFVIFFLAVVSLIIGLVFKIESVILPSIIVILITLPVWGGFKVFDGDEYKMEFRQNLEAGMTPREASRYNQTGEPKE